MHRIVLCLLLLGACLQPGIPAPLSPRPDLAADSTFLVRVDAVDGVWFGTAWIVGIDGEDTILMTAGHVCADGPALYRLLSRGNTIFPATFERKSPRVDLCSIRAKGHLGKPLAI